MINHIKYWNKWRKKYGKNLGWLYKFLVLIKLKKSPTMLLMMLTDSCNAATEAFKRINEAIKEKKEQNKETDLDEKKA